VATNNFAVGRGPVNEIIVAAKTEGSLALYMMC
jgi:hypothetical protein